jgi:hypothetical protein
MKQEAIHLQADGMPVNVLVPQGEGFEERSRLYRDPLNRPVVFDGTRTQERKWPLLDG